MIVSAVSMFGRVIMTSIWTDRDTDVFTELLVAVAVIMICVEIASF